MEFWRQSLLVINVKEPIIVPLWYKITDLAKLKKKKHYLTYYTFLKSTNFVDFPSWKLLNRTLFLHYRYSREEPPLLGAPLPSTDSPPLPHICNRCGSRLICELQLVPEFAETLTLRDHSLTHLHFLSVFVFTCAQSCWQAGDTLVNETVVFQPEVV